MHPQLSTLSDDELVALVREINEILDARREQAIAQAVCPFDIEIEGRKRAIKIASEANNGVTHPLAMQKASHVVTHLENGLLSLQIARADAAYNAGHSVPSVQSALGILGQPYAAAA